MAAASRVTEVLAGRPCLNETHHSWRFFHQVPRIVVKLHFNEHVAWGKTFRSLRRFWPPASQQLLLLEQVFPQSSLDGLRGLRALAVPGRRFFSKPE